MTHTHLIFVVLLLLLFSPSLLCSDAEVKIIGGEAVATTNLPQYLPAVSIFLSYTAANTTKFERLCGGSAFQPFAILTSISCVSFFGSKDWKNATKQIITISFTNERKSPYTVSFDNITVIPHDTYDAATPSKISVDIALVFLPKNLTVMYSTLAEGVTAPAEKVSVAGWGRTSKDTSTSLPTALNDLKKDNTEVVDMSVDAKLALCTANPPKNNAEKYTNDGDFYCLKSTTANAGPCAGDFGGPVYEQQKALANTHVQVGIIIESTKVYCDANVVGGDYFPVLRVDKLGTWINKNLKKYKYPEPVSSSGLIFFSPVLLGLSALVSLFLL